MRRRSQVEVISITRPEQLGFGLRSCFGGIVTWVFTVLGYSWYGHVQTESYVTKNS